MKQKILFIDRDGTLINEPKENFQIDSLEKLLFEPNVIPALIELKNFGYKFIIITNQDGLGSETFPQKKFDVPHNFMLKIFSSQGIKFDQILICPHLPSNKCNCRKPKIGLIKPWLEKNNLDKNNSYVIGDRETDVILAKNIKIKSIKYHKEKFNWEKIKNILIYENRNAHIHRTTKETDINIEVWLDKYHESYINTGIYFFNHLLQQIAIHAGIQMNILAKGDLYIDDHHIIEDTALTLGEALNQALKNKRGIERFGFTLPMDESVAQCILDLSGRPFFNYKANFNFQKIGDLSTEMIEHFFRSLTYKMACTLHLKTLGNNDHHKAESLFKCFGRSLRQAICINNKNFIIPSSKGTLI